MNKFKFFGKKLSIRDPKTPYKKGKFVEESNSYKSRIGSKISENPITKSLLSIRRKVFQIENTLKSMFNFNKKTDDTKKRFQVVEKEEDRNTKKVAPPKSGLGKLIQRPKTGALDLIKNFVTFTFLGWLFTVLQPLIGKLEWLFPLLQGAFNFIGVTVKFLVDALGSFIKFGYDTKDKIDNLTKNVKDSAAGVKKKFDETLTAFQNVFGGAIELVNSFINVSASEDEIASAKQDLQEQSKDAIPPLPPLPNTDTNINQPKTSTFSTSLNVQGVNTGGIIRGYNEGGGIQNARIDPKTPITRGVEKPKNKKVFKPKPNIQTQKTRPGADVGGPEKVKEIYGERISIADYIPFLSFMRPDRKSGYHALLSTSEEYKKPKYDDILGIGNLMGASVDTALGQKPERKTYTQFADGIKYLVNYGISDPEGFEKLDIEQMIRRIVEPKIDIALNKVRGEINKKVEEKGGEGPGGGGSPEGGGGAVKSIDIGGFSDADIDALGRMIAAESAGESAIGKAGVLAVILNRYRLIKSGKASPQAFAITGKTKEQVTIRDVLFAGGKGPGNQFSPYKDGNFDRTSSSSGKAALAEAIRAGGNDPEKFKQNLIKNRLSEEDADYVVRSVSFSNPRSRGSRPFKTREITVGNHVFQQSPNVKLIGVIGKVDAEISEQKKMLVEGGILPSTRLITSYRGWRWGRMHRGVDYAGAGVDHHPISVIKPGKVGFAGWDPNGGGWIVVIDHIDGTTSKYFHLEHGSIKVKTGQSISPGQIIGIVGNTGRSSGTHLHFEVWKGGKDLNDPHKLADGYFRFGGNVKPAETQKLAKKGGKEGYINHKNQFVEQKWTAEQRARFQEQTKKNNNSEKTSTSNTSTKPDTKVSQNQPQLDVNKANEYDDKLRKIKPGSGETLRIPEIGSFVAGRDLIGRPVEKYYNPNGNSISKEEFLNRVEKVAQKKKYGGLVYKNANTQTLPVEKYASYNDPMNSPQLLIQPIIVQTPISIKSTPNSTIIFSTPNVNSTDNSTQLMRS